MRVDIILFSKQKDYFLVTPHGSIDTDTHDTFREAVHPLLKKGLKGICVDLKNVEYISSAGLGVLFSMKKFLDQNKGELLFCHAQPQITKLFQAVQYLPADMIFKSLEEADRYLYNVMNETIRKEKRKK